MKEKVIEWIQLEFLNKVFAVESQAVHCAFVTAFKHRVTPTTEISKYLIASFENCCTKTFF